MNKQQLIDKHRDINVDYDWWDFGYEDFREDMEAIGIKVDNMYFSGFSSQGDGACFEGRVEDWGLFLKSVGFDNSVLIQHAMDHWSFSVKHRGRYYHENCTGFDSDLPMPEDYSGDIEHFIDRYSPYASTDIRGDAWLAVLRSIVGFDENVLIEAFKGHMRDLYRRLEREYDYRTSDEAVWETLEANGMTDELDETEA